MIKLAHLADLHLNGDDRNATLDEQVEWLEALGDHAATHGARAYLVAGDVFHAASTPDERNAAIRIVTAWARQAPVVIVRGNHDRPADLAYLAKIRTTNPVHVAERPEVLDVAGVRIACLPWPRKDELVARMPGADALQISNTVAEAMRGILGGFAVAFQVSTGPRVLLAHLELGAALADSGQPLAGRCDVEMAEADLVATGAEYVALGHIHKAQELASGSWMTGVIRYAGSPRQTTFGEEVGKGYSLVALERGQRPEVEHVDSLARRLVTINGTWDAELGNLAFEQQEQTGTIGAAIRISYEVTEHDRAKAAEDAANLRDALIEDGALSVKIDAKVTAVHRLRSAEIREARTTRAKVEALWAARGQQPARAAEILAKLDAIEGVQS